MTNEKKLKLYVWEDVLVDYTEGIMFALAYDEEHAREQIRKNGGRGLPSVEQDLLQKPKVYSRPKGFFCYGGG